MNRLSRIGVGAIAGALLTLTIHPLSQRFVLTPFHHIGTSVALEKTKWLPRNLDVLPVPEDTLIASLWMQAGAELLIKGNKLEPEEIERLIDVAEAAADGDAENAYWLQMRAVFQWEAGRRQEALESWARASTSLQWNDYQSRRLDMVRGEMASLDGGPMAWHTAASYFQRSTAAPRTIAWVARSFFERLPASARNDTQLRLATLRNGRLIRDGSRSVPVGEFGVDLVEYACIPAGKSGQMTPRQQFLLRDEMVDAVRPMGLQVVQEVDEAFRTNDAWLALVAPERAATHAQTLSAVSVLTACIPGILLGLAIVGLVIRGFVAIFEGLPKFQALLQPPFAPAVGVLSGLAIYVQTGLMLAAIAIAMCFGFLAYEPAKLRKHRPDRMSGGIGGVVATLALLFAVTVGAFWLGISAPAIEVAGNLSFPVQPFGGNTIFLSLAVLVMSLLLVAAPAWASVEKVPTPFATVVALREFSRRLFWGALCAGVLAAPTAVYVDNQLRESMNVLLTNEPAHYLLR